MWVKICGLTNIEDIEKVAAAKANAVGLMLTPVSKRYVDPDLAGQLSKAARGMGLEVVGVFLDQSALDIETLNNKVRLDLIQLHGKESPEFATEIMLKLKLPVSKAVDGNLADLKAQYSSYKDCKAILLDHQTKTAQGGTGHPFDWQNLSQHLVKSPRTIIGGGLNAQNIAELFKYVSRDQIFGLDVSSGVEKSPGLKELTKLEDFMEAVRALA